jgi:RimJ/RimL family protein N-acetyltransferase
VSSPGNSRHDLDVNAIRLAGPDDADALLDLQRRLDAQSTYMLLEPGERDETPDRLRERLQSQGGVGSFDLVADDRGALVGWLSAEVLPYRRVSHAGYVVIGVDAAASGRGIGRTLLSEATAEARRRGLRRLELTVMTDNLRAIALHLRSGFQVEGCRRHALLRDGAMVDEYYMAQLLTP